MKEVMRGGDVASFEWENTSQGTPYTVVKQGTKSNQVDVNEADTTECIGVLLNNPKKGEAARVKLACSGGTAKVIASGAVSIGDDVSADTGGKVKASTTKGDWIVGKAITEALADGDIIEIFLRPYRIGTYS